MERIYSPPGQDPRGSQFSRVKDLEHSQQWTSLASDINDLERAKMRQHATSDPRKHMLHRRSMPEPQVTSLIYVDVNTDDYGNSNLGNKSITDNYFLPIGSESNDESVDSWSWKRESDYSPDRNYFGNNNNNETYDYNRPEESWPVNNRPVINQEKNNRRNIYNVNPKRVESDRIDGEISRDGTIERDIINKDKLQPSYNNGRFDTEETAYRGSRERLHEIFRKNRDLRREFFATVPKSSSELTKSHLNTTLEFKDRSNNRSEVHQDTGSGYGSVETLTSQSNNSEISGIQNRRTENSSQASQNSRVSEATENGIRISQEVILQENNQNLKQTPLINQSANSREFGWSVRGVKDGHYNSSSLRSLKSESAVIPPSLELSLRVSNPSKSLESPGFDVIESPAPPLPTSEPPSSIFGQQLLISGDSLAISDPSSIALNPPDPPERRICDKEKFEAQDFLQQDISSSQVYKPESEGLRMLNRFEACIENRKLSPLLIQPINNSEDFGLSKKNYKSMPDLANSSVSGYPRKGVISRLAVNGSTIDLNMADNDYSRVKFNRHLNNGDEPKLVKSDDKPSRKLNVTQVLPSLNYSKEPREIHATRVDLREKSKLRHRRRRVPPPLDLSKVAEALRQENVRQDRKVLRDYSVESTPLRGELVKCKVTDLGGSSTKYLNRKENYDRPRVNAALKTATNLLDLSRNLSRPIPAPVSVPIRNTSVTKKTVKNSEDKNGIQSSGGSARFRSSVIVWCDGNSKDDDNFNVEKPRTEPAVLPRKTTLDNRKSTGSLIPTTGSVFPSVYAPIPYKSPRRYVEGEVTIHYRSPVRTEAKEVLSEAELARRSAENMRRVYQEERRRKYLQELHDIDSRRHTDNFTPTQKSPIPLNRYDDFVDDLSHRSRSQEQTPEPRLVAKALYNFVGQSSRELTFRRGDIIFVRRQVDKNWYEGEHNAMIGLFPFNYVEILPYDGIRTTTTPKKPYEGQARAKFNFVAQTTHELSLVKGDLVVLTRRVDENWYEGRIGNRKGIFPISYVEVLLEPGIRPETPAQNKPVAAPAAHSLLSNGSAGGKLSMGPHHYTPSIPTNTNAAQPHYNSLPRMGGSKLHVAPVNETLHIDTHSEPLRYRALYNYRPQNDDELELKEGDAVYVMEKCDDGWFVGSSQRTGCFGTFPGNYVERL